MRGNLILPEIYTDNMTIATLLSYTRLISPLGTISQWLPRIVRSHSSLSRVGLNYFANRTTTAIPVGDSSSVPKLSGERILVTNPNDPAFIPHLSLLTELGKSDLAQQVAKMAEVESPYIALTLHGFRTNAALLKFFIDELKFKRERIFIADKFYSTSPYWESMMRQLGVNYYMVPAPDTIGGYHSVFTHTLKEMWEAVRKQISDEIQSGNAQSSQIIVNAVSDGGD